MEESSVLVVIVLYHPDEKQLLELLRVCSQTSGQASILLFDNAEISDLLIAQFSSRVIYHQSPENVGVGGAYHYACDMAIHKNFNFLLLLDQDSQLPDNFIDTMRKNFYQLQLNYSRLAVVGPSWDDPRYPFQKKIIANKSVFFLISSGSLIWVPFLKDIGYPKKEYVIDYVDTEWCMRTFSKKYQLIRLHNVYIQHAVGEIKRIGKFSVRHHEPMRYYYRIRNLLFILRDKELVLFLRLYVFIRCMFGFFKIPFIPKPFSVLVEIFRGLKAGITTKV
jgi:rhamnosyltransferase